MTAVAQSYVIWFSQRVGSTLLTQTLEDLGIAGRPREWFEADSVASLLAKHDVTDGRGLRDSLWREATTSNGVLGLKYGMRAAFHAELVALLGNWNAVFPNCRHVFMTRRDKLRLAVSWWRAIQSGEWHRPARTAATVIDGTEGRAPRPRTPPDLVDRYDRNAIQHLLAETAVREADIQAELAHLGAVPFTIVYEDLIARYEPTVRALLDFLDIPGREGVAIPPPAFAPIADEVSDAWCRRYRKESAAP